MKIGKLGNDQLDALILKRLPPMGPDVVCGPGIGLDCAALKSPEGILVISADPITGTAASIGWLAVHISCNDIAACGVRPTALALVVIAPPQATEAELARIMDDAADAARSVSVSIIGGHTEVSDAVNRFVVMTTAFGFAVGKGPVDSRACRPGDTLIMTKTAGLEGTAILATDQAERLSARLTPEELAEAAALISRISVLPEGVLCAGLPVHGLHDATEGGMLGAVHELCDAAGSGCEVSLEAIPLHPLTRRIADALALDPYRLLSSGSLLIATPAPDTILAAMAAAGIPAVPIGRLTEDPGRWVSGQGRRLPLDPPGPDELYRA